MTIGITLKVIPFSIALIILIIRFFYTDKQTLGIFLLMFGGVLGSTIRFEFPTIPIYGLILNFIGLFLVRNQLISLKRNPVPILMLFVVLLYLLLAFLLSPNINDNRAYNKIIGIFQGGIFAFFAYYTIVHSFKLDNEALTQLLFLTVILFFIHNMNLLDSSPSNFFDYEWMRKGAEEFRNSANNVDILKWINYQVVGMNSLYGVSLFLSQLNLDIKKAYIYSIIGLQLVLFSGSRQAIFGLFVILILKIVFFNKRSYLTKNIVRKFLFFVLGISITYILVLLLPFMGVDYLTETLSEGDKGRDILRIMGWDLFIKNPLFGTGIGGFNHAYPGMLFPHNFIIEILCECGVIGSLFLIMILIMYINSQKINLLYLTKNQSFLFLILSTLGIRVMVSDDLTASIGLFSAFFACTYIGNYIKSENLQ